MRLATPASFSFLRTVFGHGWFDLPPFRWDDAARTLWRALTTAPGRHVLAEIRETAPRALAIRLQPPPAGGPPSPRTGRRRAAGARDRSAALKQVRHMLRLDEDLTEFHALCRRVDGYAWAAEARAGLLLRGADPFEDLVKMICTTNCTWALTRVMVGAIVRELGEPAGPSSAGGSSSSVATRGPYHSFPTPEAMAAAPVRFYEKDAKTGYRAAYLKTLAESVASGRVRPSRWLDPRIPVEALRAEITSVKGAGRYVADNMLKLLGRYEGLGLDTWCRRRFAEIHHRGRRVSDRTIERRYATFGRWRGLALWCDLTRDWFDGDTPAQFLRERLY